MEHIRYKKETEVVTFQGKEITLENLSPVFTPEQEAAKRRELEQQLYEVFRKYADKRQREDAGAYVNVKIAELDGRKQELVKQIAELTVEAISPEQISQISGYLDTWEDVSFDDKRRVVDLMITTIAATSDSLNITWKI